MASEKLLVRQISSRLARDPLRDYSRGEALVLL